MGRMIGLREDAVFARTASTARQPIASKRPDAPYGGSTL
jgi:hypothetical protein